MFFLLLGSPQPVKQKKPESNVDEPDEPVSDFLIYGIDFVKRNFAVYRRSFQKFCRIFARSVGKNDFADSDIGASDDRPARFNCAERIEHSVLEGFARIAEPSVIADID